MTLEFELGFLPKTTNSGGRAHWAIKAKEAREIKCMVWGKVRLSGVTFRKRPLERAKLTLTRCSSSEPDFDGLVSSFKHVIDGLVDAGVIRNDKGSTIGQPEYRWEKAKPKKGGVRVCVESYDAVETSANTPPLNELEEPIGEPHR